MRSTQRSRQSHEINGSSSASAKDIARQEEPGGLSLLRDPDHQQGDRASSEGLGLDARNLWVLERLLVHGYEQSTRLSQVEETLTQLSQLEVHGARLSRLEELGAKQSQLEEHGTRLSRLEDYVSRLPELEQHLEQLSLENAQLLAESLATRMALVEALKPNILSSAFAKSLLWLRASVQRIFSLGKRSSSFWMREGTYRTLRRGTGKVLRKLGLRSSDEQPPQPETPLTMECVPQPEPLPQPEPTPPAEAFDPPQDSPLLEPTPPLEVSHQPEVLPEPSLPPEEAPPEILGGHFPWSSTEPTLDHWRSTCLLLRMSRLPLISILVPVYKVDPVWLDLCIRSVERQHYPNWELILVDDRSQKPELTRLMKKWTECDSRIRLVELETNQGIGGATNVGLAHTSGEFVGFLDHDDELTPDALTWMVAKINAHPEAEWFYSDEDKIDTQGNVLPGAHTYFKPDFSVAHLLSCMFTCHFSVYTRDLLTRLGGIRPGFDGSQDHDLALRASELVARENIIHIPRVLYHWRVIPESVASGPEAKPYAALAGQKAVREALERRNLKGTVDSSTVCPTLYTIEFSPTRTPTVTIVIPTRDAVDDLRKCLDSIYSHTDYEKFEILVIDNRSTDPLLKSYFEEQGRSRSLRVLSYDKPFNHSDLLNQAVASVESEFVVFVNDNIEIRSDRWLEQLLGCSEIDERVAGVGCLLLHPNDTVQHGGFVYGLHGNVAHANKDVPAEHPGVFGRIVSLGQFSGCTAAMLLMKRAAFLEVGGFRSDRYPASYNDADLWLRLGQAGYQCLFNPRVQAVHGESKPRVGHEEMSSESEALTRFREDWGHCLNDDPFYNRNLTLSSERFDGVRPNPVEEDFPLLTDLPSRVA